VLGAEPGQAADEGNGHGQRLHPPRRRRRHGERPHDGAEDSSQQVDDPDRRNLPASERPSASLAQAWLQLPFKATRGRPPRRYLGRMSALLRGVHVFRLSRSHVCRERCPEVSPPKWVGRPCQCHATCSHRGSTRRGRVLLAILASVIVRHAVAMARIASPARLSSETASPDQIPRLPDRKNTVLAPLIGFVM